MEKNIFILLTIALLSFGALAHEHAEEQEFWTDDNGETREQSIEEQEEVIADPEDYPAMEDSGKVVPREKQVHGTDIFEDGLNEDDSYEGNYPEEQYEY